MSVQGQDYYSKGYDKTISGTHSWRTAENSSKYMIPIIKITDRILDIGCGPGTITKDLAQYVPKGEIIGIEPTQGLIDEANSQLLPSNVKFQIGSAYELPFDDESFDIVHAHQVFVHLKDPVSALKEARRVLKKGGKLCIRDGELKSLLIYPEAYIEPLEFFTEKLRGAYTVANGATRQKSMVKKAGFQDWKLSTSNWGFSTGEERQMLAKMFIERLKNVTFDGDEPYTKKELIEAWEGWMKDEVAVYVIMNGEIIATK